MRSFRRSRPEVFCKKGVLGNCAKFTGKHMRQDLFLNKVPGLLPASIFKKRLWRRYFPVNFAKILRSLFLCKTPLVTASLSSHLQFIEYKILSGFKACYTIVPAVFTGLIFLCFIFEILLNNSMHFLIY